MPNLVNSEHVSPRLITSPDLSHLPMMKALVLREFEVVAAKGTARLRSGDGERSYLAREASLEASHTLEESPWLGGPVILWQTLNPKP